MDFTNQIILLAGLLFLVSVLASVISARIGMPLLLAFLALGMLAGEEGPGGIHFDDVQTAHLIGSLALAIILFNGGLCTKVDNFRVGLWPAFWLATVGVILTAVITGLAAAWFFQLSWIKGLLIGAIVGSTDAAAVFSILHSHGLQLKQRVDATLQIESGINDPMAIFLTITLIEIIAAGHLGLDWYLIRQFFLQMGIGATTGLVGGWLLVWLINRVSLSSGLYPLLAFSGGLLIYGAAAVAGGSGYLAVYLAGLLLGNRRLQGAQNIHRFYDGMAWLSQISMFLILGLLVTPSHLLPVVPQGLLMALVLIVVARPLAVGLCLLPFRFTWREQAFIGWVGLRGAVPIILALFPLLAGLEHAETFFNAAFFVVLVSLVVQGWTVAPAARILGLEIPPRPSAIQREQLDLPGQYNYELVGYKLTQESPALHRLPARLALPKPVKLATIIRQGEILDAGEISTLEENDYVFLFARAEDLPALDRLFTAVHAPARLEEQRFFGELVLNADASMAEIADFYSLTLDPDDRARTLEDFLVRIFRQPVVGDRVRVSRLEFVIREMEGRHILKVGLKLIPE